MLQSQQPCCACVLVLVWLGMCKEWTMRLLFWPGVDWVRIRDLNAGVTAGQCTLCARLPGNCFTVTTLLSTPNHTGSKWCV